MVSTVAGRDVFNPNWLAPEAMSKNCEYTEKVDVYPYGIILWELLSCKQPFEEYDFTFSSQLEDAIVREQLRPTVDPVCC
jgi:serine/threonine protein kinase